MKEMKNQTQPPEEKLRIGVFICHCGLNIAGTLDIKELVNYSKTIADVVYVKEIGILVQIQVKKKLERVLKSTI